MRTRTMFLDDNDRPHASAELAADSNRRAKLFQAKMDFIKSIRQNRDAEYSTDIHVGRQEAITDILKDPQQVIDALASYIEATT